jgi:hypothetical protein
VSAVKTPIRHAERIPILGTLHGEVKLFQPTSVCEISLGGMQVETSFPLQVDSLHEFRLTLQDRSVVVKGRVAHSRITDVDQDIVMYRSGIEFVEPSEPVAEAISDFIAALKIYKA